MNAAPGLAHDTLMPRPPGGLAPGAALALLVHAVLIAALTVSVQWRSQPAEVVSAELWASVPQTAAPRADAVTPPAPPPPEPKPAPPPPPPAATPAPRVADAQIAVEQARRAREERERAEQAREERRKAEKAQAEREKAERDKAERDKAQRDAAEQRKREEAAKKREAEQRAQQERAQEKRLAEQREANLKRLLGQAGATGSPTATGTDLRDAAPSASYVGRLIAVIKPNIVFADTLPGNPSAEVEVSATASGSIIARRLRKSSGHPEWDEAVLRAIDRTGTLPRDTDGRVPTRIVISFRPQE